MIEERHPLQLSNDEVARLTRPQREARVHALIARANEILDEAITTHLGEHELAATVLLYSGGDDSTTLVHMLRHRATHAAHANTTIGIEATREHVRDTCAGWGLPLIEKVAPISYRDLVTGNYWMTSRKTGLPVRGKGGFPGPGQHYRMYQRLKERCLDLVRNELVANPRKQRIVYVAGRRRDESLRRSNVPLHERRGSVIWASPLAEWTKLDLNTYRLMFGDVPRNPASAHIHMSGECLCGAFAKAGELDMIADWFPATVAEIRALEAEIADRVDIPASRRKWGFGAYRHLKPSKSGPMCTSCKPSEDPEFLALLGEAA